MHKMKCFLFIALVIPFTLLATTTPDKDAYSGNYFWYYDKLDRTKILTSLMDSLELDYALLPLKQARLGFSFTELNKATLLTEENVPEVTDTLEQATSNIRFLDRVKAYIAKFQDTHFSIGPTTPMPIIYNGLKVTQVNGKVLVSAMDTKILSYIAKRSGIDSFTKIKIGDELVKIDGRPVSNVIAELSQFISSSSPGFTTLRAVSGLTLRTYNYPHKNYVDITFGTGQTLRFPWFYSTTGLSVRPDVNFFFKTLGFINDSSVELNWDNVKKDWVESTPNYDGYVASNVPATLADKKEYTATAFGTVIRTGYFSTNDKTYGVLELLTFQESTVKDAAGTASPYLDVIAKFIAELKSKNLPLIFDLRNNNGGNGSYPTAILSYLTESGKTYANRTSGYRITEYMRQLQEPDFYKDFPADDLSTGITNDQFKEMFLNAVRERAIYTPMFSYGDIKEDSTIGGFEQKVVALVTPNCVSACDNMSNLLKNNHRALLIGTHSNGTGAGFSSDDRLNTKWTDPRHVLSTTFPNYIFGTPGGEPGIYIFEKDSAERLCSENRPHVADIIYTTQMEDVTDSNIGWYNKAAQILEQN